MTPTAQDWQAVAKGEIALMYSNGYWWVKGKSRDIGYGDMWVRLDMA